MNLYKIIVESASTALSLQDPQAGFMPPGHNGSYQDPETPARNTAHWLITFLKAHDISGEKKFLEAARKAADYLNGDSVRPMGATFWHRRNPNKDTCNGLVGQAWTIEALALAAEALEMPELLSLAAEVFLIHPHDKSTGLWRCVSVDGTYLDFDYTFNHQLWFAAAGGLLSKSYQADDINSKVCRFLDCLTDNFKVHPSGLIKHLVSLQLFPTRKRINTLAEQTWKIKYLKATLKNRQYMKQKEIGYHSFNLYAFSLLKRQYPNHPFWQNKSFISSLDYMRSESYEKEVETSKYGYPYNPPGFEVPFILDTFYADEDTRKQQSQWVSKQLSKSYDFDANLMSKSTEDKNTHAARIYEATRLSDLQLSIPIKSLVEV